jgi:hypothetical protein
VLRESSCSKLLTCLFVVAQRRTPDPNPLGRVPVHQDTGGRTPAELCLLEGRADLAAKIKDTSKPARFVPSKRPLVAYGAS